MCMRDGRGAAREQRGGTHGDQGGGQGALRIGEEAASGLTHWGAWAGSYPPSLLASQTHTPAFPLGSGGPTGADTYHTPSTIHISRHHRPEPSHVVGPVR